MWSFEIEGEYYSVVLYLANRKYEMTICAFVYLIIIIMMTIIIIMITIITNFILISRKKLEHTTIYARMYIWKWRLHKQEEEKRSNSSLVRILNT